MSTGDSNRNEKTNEQGNANAKVKENHFIIQNSLFIIRCYGGLAALRATAYNVLPTLSIRSAVRAE